MAATEAWVAAAAPKAEKAVPYGLAMAAAAAAEDEDEGETEEDRLRPR